MTVILARCGQGRADGVRNSSYAVAPSGGDDIKGASANASCASGKAEASSNITEESLLLEFVEFWKCNEYCQSGSPAENYQNT